MLRRLRLSRLLISLVRSSKLYACVHQANSRVLMNFAFSGSVSLSVVRIVQCAVKENGILESNTQSRYYCVTNLFLNLQEETLWNIETWKTKGE